jgi:hypothetical protein
VARFTEAGDTITLVTVGEAGKTTVTAASPSLVESTVEIALTLSAEAVSLAEMVNSPVLLILVPAAPPVTLHLTV